MLDADLKFAPTPIHTFALPETVSLRQFGPLESIDPNDAMILPHGTNPDRMKFSERTGVGLSHERSDIAGAEGFHSLEGNMCGTAMRGADALPGSKATSRAQGLRRNLGCLVADRCCVSLC